MAIILFDFWGTLVNNGVRSPIKQVKEILGLKMPFSHYVLRMEKAMMTQHYDSLREAFDEVCEEFQLENDKVDELVGLWNSSWMRAEPYEDIEELAELSKKHTLCLISNTDSISVNQVLDKFDLRKYFKHIFLSCDVGLLKSEPAFYKKIISDNGFNKEEMIVLGDGIQSDVLPAKRSGLSAVLIDRRDTRDFTPKIKSLKQVESLL